MSDFEPKSGMTFESIDGRFGVFIESEGRLMLLYQDKTSFLYDTYAIFRPEYLTGLADHNLVKISRGLGNSPLAALNNHLKAYGTRSTVWKRPKRVQITKAEIANLLSTKVELLDILD